ncbi:MAG: hypothetical protein ACJ8GO_17935 [Ramlibacter sp.]
MRKAWPAAAFSIALMCALWGLTARAAEAPDPPTRAAPWATAPAAYEALKALRDAGQFKDFDAALQQLLAANSVFPDRRPAADVAWSVLGTFQFEAMLDPQRLELMLQEWRAQAPGSPFPAFVQVRLLANAAQRDVASDLPEARDAAKSKLDDARRELEDLPPGVRATELWHIAMLHVLGSRRQPDGSEGALAYDAVRRWPLDLHFHRVVLRRLHPDQGGSWAKVERFVGEATARVAASEGESMYARLYTELPAGDLAARRTDMDEARLELGFRDWQERDKGPRVRNLHATHACAARDKRGFIQVMRDLPPADIQASQWLPGHGPSACMRWGGSGPEQ